jgi:PqqD family protein of HPr-rel-A system
MEGCVTAPIKPKTRDELAAVELDGEIVVYDQSNGRLHALNPTASVVFKFLDGTATMKELADDIAAAYSAPPGEVEAQIRKLVRQFRKDALLEPSKRIEETEAV